MISQIIQLLQSLERELGHNCQVIILLSGEYLKVSINYPSGDSLEYYFSRNSEGSSLLINSLIECERDRLREKKEGSGK